MDTLNSMDHVNPELSDRARNLIGKVFAASETHDVEAFMSLVAEDIELRLGSQEPIRGKVAVRKAIGLVLRAMQRVEHRLIDAWERGDKVAFQGVADGVTLDGKRVRIPYVDVAEFEGGLVKCYWVNLDASPMMIRPAAVAAAGLVGIGALLTWAAIKRR